MFPEVLLCSKGAIGDGWGFIGGFVDPKDASLEDAAKREVLEETGLEIATPCYRGSHRIQDWRYRGREDQILTSFFTAKYLFGMPRAADDIVEVEWVSVITVHNRISQAHAKLATLLQSIYLKAGTE